MSHANVEHHRISFNFISEPPLQTENPRATLETPATRRLAQIVIACLYCLFGSGVVFGYAALKPIFIKEGVYRGLCTENDPGDDYKTCYSQELRLNLMFTIAAVITNVAALPVGTILDKFGPKITSVLGSFFLALGTILMIVAPNVPVDAYIPGFLFLGLGGPFIFISSFQLSNCFPRHSGLILALLTGAFDTSSAVFLIYRMLYQTTNSALSPSRFFLFYLIVPIFIFLAQMFIMPYKSYQTVGEIIKATESTVTGVLEEDNVVSEDRRDRNSRDPNSPRRNSVLSELSPLLGKTGVGVVGAEEFKNKVSGVWGALHGLSAFQQIKTPWWVLIALFVMVQMTRINYFVATIRSQYENLLGSYSQATQINNVFDIALPIGGVLSIPFIGLVLDNLSTPLILTLLVSLATLIGILGILPFKTSAYANVILFVLYRPLYYTAVSDYSAKVFGFQNFGRVYGLIIAVAGLFNFSQPAIDAITHKKFHGDPRPVNISLLLIALVIGTVLVGYVSRKSMICGRIRSASGINIVAGRLVPAESSDDEQHGDCLPQGHS